MLWSEEQLAVIRAPAEARILVDAGPGTGKTAVACARIAHLIESCHVDATGIWLVSFTRTAVHELRQRLAASAADPRKVAGVRIATLDAQAWAIQSGFDDDAIITGTFEDNIDRARRMIGDNQELRDYLGRVQHLLIDEAQDILGVRSAFCLEVIASLRPEVGVTVFGDEAQSIYGFSEDDAKEDKLADTVTQLPHRIRNSEPHRTRFVQRDLNQVFRTNSPILQKIFAVGRTHLRKREMDARAKLVTVRKLVNDNNDGLFEDCRKDLEAVAKTEVDASTFFLFRRRGEALDASSYLANQDKPHRLRMSGFPSSIQAWIGLILWDWCDDRFPQAEFTKRWAERVVDVSADWNRDHAWGILIKLAGDRAGSCIDVPKLRRSLAGRPPLAVCDADFGLPGPTFGTIHGAKGRESQVVRLYLPSEPPATMPAAEVEEEARIIFVGASRARSHVFVGPGVYRNIPGNLSSGRAVTIITDYAGAAPRRQAKVEIGREGDIDAECLAGKRYYNTQDAAERAQHECRVTVGRLRKWRGFNTRLGEGRNAPWTYFIRVGDEDGPTLCCLTAQVNTDLFEVARRVQERVAMARPSPPSKLYHLRTLGARTLVVDDAAVRDRLHSPWCNSGFMIAPNLVGYAMCYF